MQLDAEIFPDDLERIPELAKKAERFGFGCVWFNETKHDPFVQLTLAAGATKKVLLGTSIALAFTRSPTTTAYASWDVQRVSKGRLLLGLGSQVKGHIQRRFGMGWESPALKMKDVILAIRAVWKTWQDGSKLDYNRKFYRLDLMPPFFSPGPIGHPAIPVYVAAVNRRMAAVAGEVADGVHVHPLHTSRYLREEVVPALEAGLSMGSRGRGDVSLAASVFVATGDDGVEVRKEKEKLRGQIAFYASTRTYSRVMELHHWGDVCQRLHALSVEGKWDRMPNEVPDEMLDELVVEGEWDALGAALNKRYAKLVDRVRLYRGFDGAPSWERLARGFRA